MMKVSNDNQISSDNSLWIVYTDLFSKVDAHDDRGRSLIVDYWSC
jgi:hypothetical protein